MSLEFSEILNASSTQCRRETHLIRGQSESHLTVTSQSPPWLRTSSSVTCPCTKISIIWEGPSPLGKMSLVASMCCRRSEGQQDAKRGAVRLWRSCLSLRGIRGGSKGRSKAQVVELGEKIKKSRNDTGPDVVIPGISANVAMGLSPSSALGLGLALHFPILPFAHTVCSFQKTLHL